jgi:hypothetical protein
MKPSIVVPALLLAGFVSASADKASAVEYCQSFSYRPGCVVRPALVVTPTDARRIQPTFDFPARGILRQDLYDRNNPDNLRNDFPSPPKQPG